MKLNTELDALTRLCETFEALSQELDAEVASFKAEMMELRNRYAPGMRQRAARCATLKSEIVRFVVANRELFERPRTIELAGVVTGLRAGRPTLEWDDAELVVAAIQRELPDLAEVLTRTTVEPKKDSLKSLPPEDLAKLPVRLVPAEDAVVVERSSLELVKAIDKIGAELVKKSTGA